MSAVFQNTTAPLIRQVLSRMRLASLQNIQHAHNDLLSIKDLPYLTETGINTLLLLLLTDLMQNYPKISKQYVNWQRELMQKLDQISIYPEATQINNCINNILSYL